MKAKYCMTDRQFRRVVAVAREQWEAGYSKIAFRVNAMLADGGIPLVVEDIGAAPVIRLADAYRQFVESLRIMKAQGKLDPSIDLDRCIAWKVGNFSVRDDHLLDRTIAGLASKAMTPDEWLKQVVAPMRLFAGEWRCFFDHRSGTSERKRRRPSKSRQALTDRQALTVEVVGRHNGDIASAARELGRDRSTVEEAWNAALRKLGISAADVLNGMKNKPATSRLPEDHRGQTAVSRKGY